ncbi:hypothetical protein BGZ79_009727 [Entomortierella chlamydospora]|nr:hypothetical protein BGZ79_009727 [Entomortierella chlamydospora]
MVIRHAIGINDFIYHYILYKLYQPCALPFLIFLIQGTWFTSISTTIAATTSTLPPICPTSVERLANTSNPCIGGAKQSVGETLGYPDLAASGTAQKAQADAAQKAAEAKIHSEGIGRIVEDQAEAKVESRTGDRSMEACSQGDRSRRQVRATRPLAE